jgi:hypothetical protein
VVAFTISPTSASLLTNGTQQFTAPVTVSGGSYTQINTVLDASADYVDNTVVSGTTYFYVVTSVDASNVESAFSSQVSVAVPTP